MPSLETPTHEAAATLGARFRHVRAWTQQLVAGLQGEDCAVQSMPAASPAKWHLAHTTWFFEEFVLGTTPGYEPVHPGWSFLFNSYYQSVGPMHARHARGVLTRPSLIEVMDYRGEVDRRVLRMLEGGVDSSVAATIELGLQHEQQHQELIVTDIKHLFSLNPLEPAYRPRSAPRPAATATACTFVAGREGIVEIGHDGDAFAFDNERPRHRALLHAHEIASRPVNNSEYREFIRDGGYETASLWLSEGWNTVQQLGWRAPLYWGDDLETLFSTAGRVPIDALAPVAHISFFEADAFARWAGARLPTEMEWESLAATQPHMRGHFADSDVFEPLPPLSDGAAVQQLFGDVWEWTASPYVGYPGFRPLPGALGEYNGKFMSGQWVLRGGSCATPAGHVRATYRNFFQPADRWQFSGIRLARG